MTLKGREVVPKLTTTKVGFYRGLRTRTSDQKVGRHWNSETEASDRRLNWERQSQSQGLVNESQKVAFGFLGNISTAIITLFFLSSVCRSVSLCVSLSRLVNFWISLCWNCLLLQTCKVEELLTDSVPSVLKTRTQIGSRRRRVKKCFRNISILLIARNYPWRGCGAMGKRQWQWRTRLGANFVCLVAALFRKWEMILKVPNENL